MKIHVYALCHNEEQIIPWFLRYYRTLSDRIVVFDNDSTDRSVELLREGGAKVRPFDTGGLHSDRLQTDLKSTCYRESRGEADWVIVVDMDEFIYHPQLLERLAAYTLHGVTLPRVQGYDMVSDHPPSGSGQIFEEIRMGFQNSMYSKTEIFNPYLDVVFDPGCHTAKVGGVLVVPPADETFLLLHYRFLGPDYYALRMSRRMARMSRDNVVNGWGFIQERGIYSGNDPAQHTPDFLREQYAKLIPSEALVQVI